MRFAALTALLLPALALGFPPGAPMSDLGPSQVALGLFFDHSGQDLFEELAPSVLNTTGVSVEYAPWPYLALGVFGGGAEFDVDVPDGKVDDTAAVGFNTGFSLYGGASAKLATPRLVNGTSRLVLYGSAGYLDAADNFKNEKSGILCNAGGSLQFLTWGKLNFVVGGEFQALLRGEQTSSVNNDPEPFGISEPIGILDYLRGLVGVEYHFKGKNQPFISVAFRPTGVTNWHDNLGLRNASVSVVLGAIATINRNGKNQVQEEEPGMAED